MIDQPLNFLTDADDRSRPLHAIRPSGLDAFFASLPEPAAAFLRDSGFAAKPNDVQLIPGPDGIAGAVIGLGNDRSPFAFGGLGHRLPKDSVWSLQAGDYDASDAVLGYCLGAYRYTGVKPAEREPAKLVRPANTASAELQARAIWMVRDLINTPANLLGPVELAEIAVALGVRYGASATVIRGEQLEAEYPTVAAVGRGSARPPRVVTLRWQGSAANESSPLLSLCGKGVCFDTGGYDLKPSSAMLRMKKDMGGAATVLGLARAVMESDLPIRLVVRVGCVENSVSGTAMRPLDSIRTKSGLTVEIGNTDAEGRLVLCDLLHEASAESPNLLLDCATLTGAARVALGPDLPALFCSDDDWANDIMRIGTAVHDPLWRLPLWDGYDDWLKSPVSDLNNVSSRPQAGAIVAALYLRRFVSATVPWAHIDLYAWNDQTRPGRPEGGESQSLRAVFQVVKERMCNA